MDEFLKEIAGSGGSAELGFTMIQMIMALVSSAILSMLVSVIYRQTHSGLSYSRSFVLSIIIMSITVSFIMLIIGSNLARAFSLVGALSIVRYRNAIKDTQDISYIFLAISIGMACGTKLYVMALIFTAFAGALLLILDKISFGSEGRVNRLFSFTFDSGLKIGGNIETHLSRLSKNGSFLLSKEVAGNQEILTFEVDIPKNGILSTYVDELHTAFPDAQIKVISGFDKFNI